MDKEEKIELRSEEFQEILGAVPSWILRWGFTAIAIIVVVLLIGSAIIKYPDTIGSSMTLTGTTPASGIVSRTSGKLQELYVSDNQHVETGNYLAVIENPAETKDILFLKNYLSSFENDVNCALPPKEIKLGNLQTLYSSFYTTLFDYLEYKRLLYYQQKIEITKERITQYEAQYRNLLRQQKIGDEQFTLAGKQFRRDSLLHQKGLIAHEEYEKSQNAYLQSAMSQENMQSSVNNMRIQIEQLKESLLDTEQQDIEKSNSLQIQLHSLVSQLKTEIQAWELNYVLQAPFNGRITFSNYWIANQNIVSGETVFNIVPDENGILMGKALLPVNRSGKVKVGQKVNIRFENFPDNEFGIVKGIVENISLVPSESKGINGYVVKIDLPQGLMTTYKKELPYMSNMQAQADIVTEDLSLLDRFFMPLKKVLLNQ